MNPTRVPHKSAHNYYGMGTYLGLAGALLAMIILFSAALAAALAGAILTGRKQ